MILPVYGQMGPAMISRGEAPNGMVSNKVDFRPYVNAAAGYQQGIVGVSVNPEGTVPDLDSSTLQLGFGVSGVHSWRRTQLGLSYSGTLTHYSKAKSFDSLTQALSLSLTRNLSRHVTLSVSQSAGVFTNLPGLRGLQQTITFDPATIYVPTTEFYNNRTIYLTGRGGLTYQRTARLSFNFGGGAFAAIHRSSTLKGSRGLAANGDFQYRVSRHATLGAMYQFSTFRFTGIYGDSYIHGAAATIGYQFSQRVEFSGFAGFLRAENKFVESVPLDPAIVALLGIRSARQVVHNIAYRPNWSGRISRTYPKGVLYVSAGQAVAPGNGLFLTSYTTSVLGGYTYTGLRRWSFSAQCGYIMSKSVANIEGAYGTLIGGTGLSRKITESLHFTVEYSARRYDSGTYESYNRLSHSILAGLAFSPGDLPLRLW